MSVESEITGSGILNFLFCALIAAVSILIGGSWLIGLLVEPEKAETFMYLVSFGGLLGGIGCGLNCVYIVTKRRFKWLFYLSLLGCVVGYGLAVFGQSIYENL